MAVQLPRNLYRTLRLLGVFFAVTFPILTFTYKSCTHDGYNVCSKNGKFLYEHSQTLLPSKDPLIPAPNFYSHPASNHTVDMVMATVVGDDISWTENIHRVQMGQWTLKQYFADSETSTYHAPKNKGREATMYMTYILAHYDSLPDYTIFVHAHEKPWHVEDTLLYSMTETLNLLDLEDVQRRGFANLRVDWMNACPDWIRTDVTEEETSKQEEPFMYRSFVENFSTTNSSSDVEGGEVPRVFGSPCCSQFAVSRETILQREKHEYQRYLDNLLNTELTDYIYGRTWEHMWQFLFKRVSVDCPVEWKTICTLYRVCFPNVDEYVSYIELGLEIHNLNGELDLFKELRHPTLMGEKRQRIKEARHRQLEMRDDALKRGLDPDGLWRKQLGNIYEDEV